MGLLDSVIEAAKQQYQTTKRGFGLLASNPQQFAQEATARYFPTKEEEAQFAQAQAAGGDYMQTPYYQKVMNLSQFQGSIKPTGLLNAPMIEQPSLNQNVSKPVNLQTLANEAMLELKANPNAVNKQKYLDAKERASQEFVALKDAPQVAKVATEIQDYKGQHTAPMKDSGKPLWDLTGIYPDDFYSSQGARYYGHGEDLARDSRIVSQIQSFKGRPDRPITIYRSVPKDIEKGKSLNAGDWITTDRQYAKEHGESALGGNYKIIKKTVKARDIYTNGDSIYEFGYDPQPYTPKSQR